MSIGKIGEVVMVCTRPAKIEAGFYYYGGAQFARFRCEETGEAIYGYNETFADPGAWHVAPLAAVPPQLIEAQKQKT